MEAVGESRNNILVSEDCGAAASSQNAYVLSAVCGIRGALSLITKYRAAFGRNDLN